MERKNARTAGRSALAQSSASVEVTGGMGGVLEIEDRFVASLGMKALSDVPIVQTKLRLHRNADGVHDFAQSSLGRFGFFL